jgi:CHAT domain-containing protein
MMEVETMKKMMPVMSAVIENRTLILNVDKTNSLDNVIPKGQMLVDSDQFSFVYILEIKEEYTYLVLTSEIWYLLKEAIDQTLPIVLSNQKNELPLPMFFEELTYLIENIKGNSNYGEEMVEKVESTF